MLDHLIEEVSRCETLALEPALHIRHRQEDGVDLSGFDLRAQDVEVEASRRLSRVQFLLLSNFRPARTRPSLSWQTLPPAPGLRGGGGCRGRSRRGRARRPRA